MFSVSAQNEIYWGGKSWAYGCEFLGRDLIVVPATSTNCPTMCSEKSTCTHYTWKPVDGGQCHLKSGYVSKSQASPVINSISMCGIISENIDECESPIIWTGNQGRNCDFPGNTFAEIKISAHRCPAQCDMNRNCTHFSWLSADGGVCLLKTGKVTKDSAICVSSAGALCGLSQNEIPSGVFPTFSLLPGIS